MWPIWHLEEVSPFNMHALDNSDTNNTSSFVSSSMWNNAIRCNSNRVMKTYKDFQPQRCSSSQPLRHIGFVFSSAMHEWRQIYSKDDKIISKSMAVKLLKCSFTLRLDHSNSPSLVATFPLISFEIFSDVSRRHSVVFWPYEGSNFHCT